MIAIVDTGGANITSVVNAFRRMNVKAELTDDPEKISAASHVLLPGVGAAADSMNRLAKNELIPLLRSLTQPVLGICLGMQILFEHSQEGDVSCLALLPGSVTHMESNMTDQITIPHMGWNHLQINEDRHRLLDGLPETPYVYFVHSYRAPAGPYVLATSHHGEEFPAVVGHKNFLGTQFHPERSGPIGAQILRNFISL